MWAVIFLSFFLMSPAQIEMPGDAPGPGEVFSNIIRKAAIRLQDAEANRSLKLKHWNDSLGRMAAAVRLMATKGSPEAIWQHLEESRRAYPKNSFAILLQAVLLSSQQEQSKADTYFEEFLLNSRTFSEFEEAFLHWAEFHQLRRTVYHLLLSHGIDFKGREKEIQIYIPYESFFAYVMNPERNDFVINIMLVGLIVFGGVLLIIGSLRGMEFNSPLATWLGLSYLMIWIAYGFWIFDLAFGLPFGWSRLKIVPLFLFISIGALGLMEARAYWIERNRPLAEGYRRCPRCRAVIVKLSIECPVCRERL